MKPTDAKALAGGAGTHPYLILVAALPSMVGPFTIDTYLPSFPVIVAATLTVIGPLVIHTFGLAIAMPAITILALVCFLHHRGRAASMQGFLQMLINAGLASVAVPLLHTQRLHFVLGQLVFLRPCWGCGSASGRVPPKRRNAFQRQGERGKRVEIEH